MWPHSFSWNTNSAWATPPPPPPHQYKRQYCNSFWANSHSTILREKPLVKLSYHIRTVQYDCGKKNKIVLEHGKKKCFYTTVHNCVSKLVTWVFQQHRSTAGFHPLSKKCFLWALYKTDLKAFGFHNLDSFYTKGEKHFNKAYNWRKHAAGAAGVMSSDVSEWEQSPWNGDESSLTKTGSIINLGVG